jgi:hypothetical protein
MVQTTNDDRYYEVAGAGSVGERLLIAARDRIYKDFERCCKPLKASTILDFGVSDVVSEGANLLERKYPYCENITAVGLNDAHAFRAAYPAVCYFKVEANTPLPFPNLSFDIATSNAVLEHMGSRARQRFMISELLRVARQVFITVPHRYFPVEHHTAIPLLHYWTPTFRLACRILGKSAWAKEENLIFMSRRSLSLLVPATRDSSIGFTGIKCGQLSSNLYLHMM